MVQKEETVKMKPQVDSRRGNGKIGYETKTSGPQLPTDENETSDRRRGWNSHVKQVKGWLSKESRQGK